MPVPRTPYENYSSSIVNTLKAAIKGIDDLIPALAVIEKNHSSLIAINSQTVDYGKVYRTGAEYRIQSALAAIRSLAGLKDSGADSEAQNRPGF